MGWDAAAVVCVPCPLGPQEQNQADLARTLMHAYAYAGLGAEEAKGGGAGWAALWRASPPPRVRIAVEDLPTARVGVPLRGPRPPLFLPPSLPYGVGPTCQFGVV